MSVTRAETSEDESEPRTLKCVVVGDAGVGKKSLLVTYVTKSFPNGAVIFDNTTIPVKYRGQPYLLNLWCGSGLEKHTSLRSLAYTGADVFVICFSTAVQTSLETLQHWIQEIQVGQRGIPYIIVGTQIDAAQPLKTVVDSIDADPLALYEGLHAGHADRGLVRGAEAYLKCSAATGRGVSDVFNKVISSAILGPGKRQSLSRRRLSGALYRLSSETGLQQRMSTVRERLRLRPIEETDESVSPAKLEITKRPLHLGYLTPTNSHISLASTSRAYGYERTLHDTWVYNRARYNPARGSYSTGRASSIRSSIFFTSRFGSTLLEATHPFSVRSVISFSMASIVTSKRSSYASGGSADRNATATLEVIEQYASSILSLDTALEVEEDTTSGAENSSPGTNFTWSGISAGDNAQQHIGNNYTNVTNNYTIVFNLVVGDTASARIEQQST